MFERTTRASRGDLFGEDTPGMMISVARQLMSGRPNLRPNVPNCAVPEPTDVATDEVLLNSLCQFDILYCLVVDADGQHSQEGYPVSAAMYQERADPAFGLVSKTTDARSALFPTVNHSRLVKIIKDVFVNAKQESLTFGGHWWSLPRKAERFISEQLLGQF